MHLHRWLIVHLYQDLKWHTLTWSNSLFHLHYTAVFCFKKLWGGGGGGGGGGGRGKGSQYSLTKARVPFVLVPQKVNWIAMSTDQSKSSVRTGGKMWNWIVLRQSWPMTVLGKEKTTPSLWHFTTIHQFSNFTINKSQEQEQLNLPVCLTA